MHSRNLKPENVFVRKSIHMSALINTVYEGSCLDLQEFQRGQAIKHPSGQLSDLITIQNPAHREELDFPNRTSVNIYSIGLFGGFERDQ